MSLFLQALVILVSISGTLMVTMFFLVMAYDISKKSIVYHVLVGSGIMMVVSVAIGGTSMILDIFSK